MRKVSAIRSLTTEFLRAGGFPWACYLSPAASSWIGSATSFCHLLAAKAGHAASLSSPAASTSDHRNVVQRDRCWILVVTIPTLRDFCFFPIFSITLFPFLVSLIRIIINWSDQYLNRCFLISRRVYNIKRTSSPSHKSERDSLVC